jgi:hypothetical protein
MLTTDPIIKMRCNVVKFDEKRGVCSSHICLQQIQLSRCAVMWSKFALFGGVKINL